MVEDSRPWSTLCFKLPEDVRVRIEEALALAVGFGLAKDRMEALEALAVEFTQQHLELLMRARRSAKDRYKANSLDVLAETGFRCAKCGHSQHLTIHHIFPRGYHGPDRPADIDAKENLVPLCFACHENIQPRWRVWVTILMERKRRMMLEVARYGYLKTVREQL